MAPQQNSTQSTHATVHITPPWPARPYRLACTAGMTQKMCDRFGDANDAARGGCDEPERDTAEIFSSLLAPERATGFGKSVVVDVGCNIGFFAAQASAMGWAVHCYEPQPHMVRAINATARLNNFTQLHVVHGAVEPNASASTGHHWRDFHGGYRPCAHKSDGFFDPYNYRAPVQSLSPILFGKVIELLKLDIDSIEGALLTEAVRMVQANETRIESFLVELGDTVGSHPVACQQKYAQQYASYYCKGASAREQHHDHPRAGDVGVLWTLQQELGYELWRVNVHVNREILDSTGANVNTRMNKQDPEFEPFWSVRAIRKIERLRRSTPYKRFPYLFKWGQSVLATKVALREPLNLHHNIDLALAGVNHSKLWQN